MSRMFIFLFAFIPLACFSAPKQQSDDGETTSKAPTPFEIEIKCAAIADKLGSKENSNYFKKFAAERIKGESETTIFTLGRKYENAYSKLPATAKENEQPYRDMNCAFILQLELSSNICSQKRKVR